MDNATYDELSLTPISSDETYSRLRVINKVKPNDEPQRRADIDQSTTKEVKPTDKKEALNSTKISSYNEALSCKTLGALASYPA